MRLDACPGLQNRCKAGCILLPISSMHSIQERPSLENVCYTKTSTPAANATTTQPITFIWDFSTNLSKHSQSALNTVLKVQDVEHIKWIHEYSFVWGTEILMYTEIVITTKRLSLPFSLGLLPAPPRSSFQISNTTHTFRGYKPHRL